VSIKCPECRSVNPESKTFCGDCGAPLHPTKDIPDITKTLETPAQDLARGAVFADRYQIIEELGAGGMGKVYRVEDTQAKEEIALKLIKPEIAADKNVIERFRNELTAARKIRHKNVCGMYDLGEDRGSTYITMEYVPGEDLKSLIHRVRIDTRTAIKIAKQICEGLSEAHRLGIVHRDLKPSNIMVDKDGNARIMDFGVARSLKRKDITGSGVMIGTPEYMSPEQVDGKDVDHRSDIYSLGILLYQMVTATLPFEGETPISIAHKHKYESPREPKEINPQLPDALNTVIMQCLTKERERRFQSTEELHSGLEALEERISETQIETPKRKPLALDIAAVKPELKKILIPALVVAGIIVLSLIVWQILPQKGSVSPEESKPSIAVMPFEDLSPGRDQGYLCNGLAESIIHALTKVENLRITARSSAFSLRDKTQDIKEIGEKLNVESILQGSLQKAGSRIRVTAQLTDVIDNSLIWSEQFDKNLEDIFVIQDQITMTIVEKLRVKLLRKEKERIARRYTGNQEAYQFYLRGRELSKRHTEAGYKEAIGFFKKAIGFDPNYALAYVDLANCYRELSKLNFLPHDEGYPKAKQALRIALELDDELGEAYAQLGATKFLSEWDMSGPDDYFQRAVKLSPGSADTYVYYSQYLVWVGRPDEGLAMARKAVNLDPLTLLTRVWLAAAYFYANRYDESIAQNKVILELDPDFVWAHIYLCHNYTMKGMNAEALLHLDKVESISLALDDYSLLSWVGDDYARIGKRNKAREILKKTIELHEKNSIDAMAVVTIYSALEQRDHAFDWLIKAIDEKSGLVVYLKVYEKTILRELAPDPRYADFLKRIGFQE